MLAKLPASVAADYDGYTSPVAPSAWANWKPSHAAPYKVAIIWNPPVNTFAVNTLKAMTAALKAAGDVDIISSTAPQSPSDVPGNIALYNQAVAEKPDLIISFPLASGPLIPAVEAAAKKGIPTVSPWVATATPNAVSVGTNDWLQAVTLASKVVTQLKGSGTILEVHGIPGVQEDDDAFAGFNSVLAQCPDITIAGQVTGDYNPAATQQAVLQFLSSHPGKVDGVFEAGTMTAGIIQAFKQLGRPVPVIADLGSTEGSIAYAGENESSYQEYGASTPDDAIGQTVRQGGARHARRSRARARPARHHHQHHRQRQPQFGLPQQLDAVRHRRRSAAERHVLHQPAARRLPGRPGMTGQSPATSGGVQEGPPPLVAAIAVAKSFGATRALVRADLDLRQAKSIRSSERTAAARAPW